MKASIRLKELTLQNILIIITYIALLILGIINFKHIVNFLSSMIDILMPFIIVYAIFQLVPMAMTIYNSFFENYMQGGLTQIGPNFVGIDNYKAIFSQGDIWLYTKNTIILWIMCFVPQIILSLVLGAWF